MTSVEAAAPAEAAEPAPSSVPLASTETKPPVEASAPSDPVAQAPKAPAGDPDVVKGLRRVGWWGAWGAVGAGAFAKAGGAKWALSARSDANPVGDLLVSGKLRYASGLIDTDAAVGLLISRDFEVDGMETWQVETGKDQEYVYYDVYGTQAAIRTEWAIAGGARLLHVGGDASHTETVLQAGFERLRANSKLNRYTTSLRALYNPAAGKWGGAVTWMYANPPTWRFVYGIEAGLLPAPDTSVMYVMLDVGIAMGN